MADKPYKQITVASNEDANECLYIDGKAWKSTGEITVYACDIAEAAGDQPVLIEHRNVLWPNDQDWPDDLAVLPTEE